MAQLPLFFFLFLATLSQFSTGFTFIVPPRHPTQILAGAGGGPGAPAVEKTKTRSKEKVVNPGKAAPKAAAAQPKTRREHETEDAPRYKLMLIGDQEYDEQHVVERIVDVVDDVDKKMAIEVFYAAQKAGKGMIGVFVLEMAEFYMEQLSRSEPMIFSDLEKEGKS